MGAGQETGLVKATGQTPNHSQRDGLGAWAAPRPPGVPGEGGRAGLMVAGARRQQQLPNQGLEGGEEGGATQI